MAAILPFLLLSAIFTVEAQLAGNSIVRPGSLLRPSTPSTNSTWLSRSGLYAFGFYKKGDGYALGIFIAGIPQKIVVWTANRDDPPLSVDVMLNFTGDGRLVLQSAQGTQPISSFADGVASASMLDSGNFVLYGSDNVTELWRSFDHPTDTILATQTLSVPQVMYSSVSESDQSTGIFRAIMQENGWLAMYPVDTPRTIEYGYSGQGKDGEGTDLVLHLEADGFLYLRNSKGIYIKNMTSRGNPTEGVLYFLRIDSDGILRLHKIDQNGIRSVTWYTPNDPCMPKGLCGLNGICFVSDLNYACKCLPGFAVVNEGRLASGCERSFTAESCKSNKTGTGRYAIEAVPSIVWDSYNYSMKSLSTEEDCRKACLADCNCEAALFKDGVCSKERLPIRFGRTQTGDTTKALIKVGVSTLTTDRNVPRERKKEDRHSILIVGASLVAFAFLVVVISGIAIYRYRVWAYEMISKNGNTLFSEDVGPKSFTYAELEKATGGFEEELGRGAFGIVYKGTILNGQKLVAVKRLERLLVEREREFQTEMKVIGKTHHRNLVRLLGYCNDGPNRLLVYEYMVNGSLADVLFTQEILTWNERMGIARDIARGILYLHEECEPQIIHCDIKPQNILVDEQRRPKISDFGLAKLLKPDQTKTFTDIRGTRGYVAPEWHWKLPVTVKVDVYSFGIVLLEIICCRRSVDYNLPEEAAILEEWAYQCFERGELAKLLVNDEHVDQKELGRMVKVALWCILEEPSLRPSMKNCSCWKGLLIFQFLQVQLLFLVLFNVRLIKSSSSYPFNLIKINGRFPEQKTDKSCNMLSFLSYFIFVEYFGIQLFVLPVLNYVFCFLKCIFLSGLILFFIYWKLPWFYCLGQVHNYIDSRQTHKS